MAGALFFFLAGTKEEDSGMSPEPITKEELKEDSEAADESLESEKIDDVSKGDEPTDDKSIFRKAVAAKDAQMCKEIASSELQNECWNAIHMALALGQANESECKKIRNDDQKQYCLDQIWLDIAQKTSDFSQCDRIQHPSLLKKCNQQKTREQIMSVTSISDCEGISEDREKRLCEDFFISKKIEEKKEPTVDDCSVLSQEDDQRRCELNITAQKAEEMLDPNQCRTLSNTNDQKECIKKVQRSLQMKQSSSYMNTGDVEGCDSFADDDLSQYCRDRALGVRALQDHNALLCYEIQDEIQRDTCFLRATSAANNHYYGKAREEKDPKWCDMITDEKTKITCISLVNKIE